MKKVSTPMKKTTNTKKVIKSLRKKGERVTKAREEIISIIFSSKRPVTSPTIQERLEKKGISVNKTTVYRELDFLLENEIISQVNLGTDVNHYEAAHLPHHHHLVCDTCGDISEVICDEIEEPMEKLVKRVQTSGFKIDNHMLEFYGTCLNCTT